MALASAAKSLSKTVASPGVLFDVVPRGALAAAGTSTSLLGQALGFIGNANHDMSSYWAKSHVMSTFADFNEKIFEQELAPVRNFRSLATVDTPHDLGVHRTHIKPFICITPKRTMLD